MDKLVGDMKNPEAIKKTINRNKLSFISGGSVFVTVLIIYHFFSDKDFSFLLTLGSITSCAGFAMLLYKMTSERTCKGLSAKTLQVYAAVFAARLSSILFFEGYLPYDRTGDWMYQCFEVLSLVLCVSCLVMVVGQYKTSYQVHMDSFGNMKPVPPALGAVLIMLPCLVFAMIFHPSLNNFWLTDVAWAWAMYMETFAIFPQLIMFQKNKSGEIDMLTSHFVSFLGLTRLFHMLFWITSHVELNDKHSGGLTGKNVGYVVVIFQVIQLLLMGDYLYFYIKAIRRGDSVVSVHTPLPK